jgi:hypothetical protein
MQPILYENTPSRAPQSCSSASSAPAAADTSAVAVGANRLVDYDLHIHDQHNCVPSICCPLTQAKVCFSSKWIHFLLLLEA